jgi:transcriptional regulator with XRE-family HTH domain
MFARRVRDRRLQKDLTQEQLARASRVSLRTIQRIENHQHAPQRSTAARLAVALEVDVEDLYSEPIASPA